MAEQVATKVRPESHAGFQDEGVEAVLYIVAVANDMHCRQCIVASRGVRKPPRGRTHCAILVIAGSTKAAAIESGRFGRLTLAWFWN